MGYISVREFSHPDVAMAADALPAPRVYVEYSGHIDVWRVLHGQQDIPAWMQEHGAE
jgi:plasmid stabilization system protein ParE